MLPESSNEVAKMLQKGIDANQSLFLSGEEDVKNAMFLAEAVSLRP